MYALRPSTPPQRPTRRSQPVSRPRLRQRTKPHRAIAIEATVKLGVNLLLSTTAIVALAQLLPYRTSQEEKLQELQVTVKSAGERVQQTRSSFSRYFDPYQAKAIMQEQSNRIDPQQRQIVWQEPKLSIPQLDRSAPKISNPMGKSRPSGY